MGEFWIREFALLDCVSNFFSIPILNLAHSDLHFLPLLSLIYQSSPFVQYLLCTQSFFMHCNKYRWKIEASHSRLHSKLRFFATKADRNCLSLLLNRNFKVYFPIAGLLLCLSNHEPIDLGCRACLRVAITIVTNRLL